MKKTILAIAALMLCGLCSYAQENSNHGSNTITRMEESILFYQRLSDVAYVDIVRLTGPAKAVAPETDCEFKDSLRTNKLKFHSYVFIPRSVQQNRKYPLIVLPHGGVHSNFAQGMVHIVRELMAQGYIVIAPDYRGSTGYGKDIYEAIDYGGLEYEDVCAARDYMCDCYSIVDSTRVGLLGWSHGGMISLMNILNHPDKFTCAYAGVPVSDLAFRLSYQKKDYVKNFNQPYHIGATPEENPAEYARRSPVSYASKLCRPLMITTCVNDDDVCHLEVERMIDTLKAEGKDFRYRIYPPMEGAHLFERIDIREACEVRLETYGFLAGYLKPDNPVKTFEELRKAGYYFY